MSANPEPREPFPSDATSLDHLRARVTLITPDRARLMLSSLSFDRQRNIRPYHVDYLTKVTESGELRDLIVQECELPNGRKILVDGYHRLMAIIKTNKALPAVIVTHRVMDDGGIAERYAMIDRPSSRTTADALKAFDVTSKTKLSPSMLSTIAAAASVVNNDFPTHYRGHEFRSMIQRAHTTEDWLAEGEQYSDCIAGASKEIHRAMTRVSVMAVGLATLRYESEKASEFWTRVALEDGLARNSPEWTLLRFLRNSQEFSLASVGKEAYTRYVISAWNAFFEGRDLQLIRAISSRSMRINGTPYAR